MFTSFSTALSALSADSTALDVVSNNLANLNTSGFKASETAFHDLVSEAFGSSPDPGFGVSRPTIIQQFSQGAVQTSSGSLDAAIQGDGFFVLKDKNNNQLFTRGGKFVVDSSGVLQTLTGERVQGWADPNGNVNTNGPVGDIVLPTGTLRQAFATTKFSLNLNLDASATVGATSGTFSAPMQVVDSLGSTHDLTITFTKTGINAWSYGVTVPGSDLTGGTAGTPSSLATGTITFDSFGNLVTPAAPTVAAPAGVPIPITGLADGAADLSINWNLYDSKSNPLLSQFAQTSATSGNSQDGTVAAQLVKVAMQDGGAIVAQYSNGQEKTIAQVALASIRNPDTLVGVGSGNLKQSQKTGLPSIGVADTGGRGKVAGGSLESSTVDIAREFTNLIVLQRGYQANAKVITTEDQLSQETINIKQ